MSQDELIGRLRAHERQCLDEAKRARDAISALEGVAITRAAPAVGKRRPRRAVNGGGVAPEAVLDALRTVPESRAATRIVADALGVSPKVVLPKLKELQKSGAVRREGGVTTPVWAIA